MTGKWIRSLAGALSLLVVLMVSQPAAIADEVQMTLTSPTSSSTDYYDGVFLSPYTAAVTPVNASDVPIGPAISTSVICIDFSDETYLNQTWTAYTSAAPDTTAYDAIADLARQLPGADLSQQALLSFAIWDILENSAVESYLGGSTNSFYQAVHAEASFAESTAPAGLSANLIVYTPTSPAGCGVGTCGTPQVFVSLTPEGSTVATLLVDLLGLAGAMFFLRRRLTNRLSN